MANPASPGSELQKSTKHILQIVHGANGATDTVFPTLFRVVEPADPSRSEAPRYGIRPEEKICNPEKLRQNIVSTVSKLANLSIRTSAGLVSDCSQCVSAAQLALRTIWSICLVKF